jgi:branched-chain amino acid transport system permease protein
LQNRSGTRYCASMRDRSRCPLEQMRRSALGLRNRPLTPALATAALLGAILIAGPVLDAAGQPYWVLLLTRALLLAVLAVATDIAWGVTGIFTLGQAVFFGIGAYVVALLATRAGLSSVVPLAAAALIAGAFAGLLIGAFLFQGRRRVGPLYVALVTLALTYAFERLANVWAAIGSGTGITGLPLPSVAGIQIDLGLPYLWVAEIALLVVLGLGWALNRSQLGLVMRAIRDDDERTEFLGYRRPAVQVAVFSITSAFCSLAGGLYALEEGFASPSFLGVALSTQVLIYILLGGRGTIVGPLLGVLLFELGGQQIQQALPSEWPILVGSILLLVILLLPRGLLSIGDRFGNAPARPAVNTIPTTTGVDRADPHGD